MWEIDILYVIVTDKWNQMLVSDVMCCKGACGEVGANSLYFTSTFLSIIYRELFKCRLVLFSFDILQDTFHWASLHMRISSSIANEIALLYFVVGLQYNKADQQIVIQTWGLH